MGDLIIFTASTNTQFKLLFLMVSPRSSSHTHSDHVSAQTKPLTAFVLLQSAPLFAASLSEYTSHIARAWSFPSVLHLLPHRTAASSSTNVLASIYGDAPSGITILKELPISISNIYYLLLLCYIKRHYQGFLIDFLPLLCLNIFHSYTPFFDLNFSNLLNIFNSRKSIASLSKAQLLSTL